MGKREKENQVTRQFSSGGVVFRNGGGLWLVTRSNPSQEYPQDVWRLPKGWIDEGEKPEETALREVIEEGGVKAKIVRKIETVKYFFTTSDKQKVLKFVTFYLMEFIKDWPEGFGEETAETVWLPYKEAYAKLSYPGEKQILKKAKELLV
ncbi:NUDIX hydrolase [Candidatus Woesebacteria bacterium CG07_land_8_20_14_0_80_44_9]|uniref:NUDIX hydrolase n=1 Tax=Candidatus Woesebacteria bacterium CG07_land_8_20_14_0_80_44_9 TaxID=1975058 RepID=A0A2M6YFA7_9BACT|nr:MAG: NUDIX hydrolase [Candidatus Woesebacteria bacterium CG07_land_8_20_14_0_80_44_9]